MLRALPTHRRQLLVAIAIGLLAGLACFAVQTRLGRGAGDLAIPLCASRALLRGDDPYRCPHTDSLGKAAAPYPLTTALVLLPLAPLPDSAAAGVFFGVSSGLLAYGVLHAGWSGLLVFATLPYWAALQTVQWPPLFLAACSLPLLAALAPAKPQQGIVPLLMRHEPRALLGAALLVLVSLLLLPSWPWTFLSQARTYEGTIPLLSGLPFSALLLLAILRWREPRAQLLLLMAILPQRLWYDQLLLFATAETTRERLWFAGVSWLVYFGSWRFGTSVWLLVLYFFVLGMVLTAPRAR